MTERQKELVDIIRYAGEVSNGRMPVRVIVNDNTELAWLEKWRKGKRGLNTVTVALGKW